MNPRHRRLLIPGLLIALLLVVVIGAILGKANAAQPAHLGTWVITESSGRAVSVARPGPAHARHGMVGHDIAGHSAAWLRGQGHRQVRTTV